MNYAEGEQMVKAAKHINLSEVIRLTTSGVNPNYVSSEDGRTALHYAIINKDFNMLTYLLNVNATDNIKDNHGKKPSDYNEVPKTLANLNGLPYYGNVIKTSEKPYNEYADINNNKAAFIRVKIYNSDRTEVKGQIVVDPNDSINKLRGFIHTTFDPSYNYCIYWKCADSTLTVLGNEYSDDTVGGLITLGIGSEIFIQANEIEY